MLFFMFNNSSVYPPIIGAILDILLIAFIFPFEVFFLPLDLELTVYLKINTLTCYIQIQNPEG